MKETKKSGIYEMWFGDMVYVGQSSDLEQRALKYLHHPAKIKHGKPSNVILIEMPNSTRKERVCAEEILTDKYKSQGVSLNLMSGKKGAPTAFKAGHVTWNKGKKTSEETKSKLKNQSYCNKVTNGDTTFTSVSEASRVLKIPRTTFGEMIKRGDVVDGKVWRYVKNN